MRHFILLVLILRSWVSIGQNAEDAAKFNEVRFALENKKDCKIANQVLNEMSESSKTDPLYYYYKMGIFNYSYCPCKYISTVHCELDSAIYFTEKYLSFFPANMDLQKKLVELKYKKRSNEEWLKEDSIRHQGIILQYLNFRERTFVKSMKAYNFSELYDTMSIRINDGKIYVSFSNYLTIWNQRYTNRRILDKMETPRVYYSAVIDFPNRYSGNGNYIEISALFSLDKVIGQIPNNVDKLNPLQLEEFKNQVKGTIIINKTHNAIVNSDIYAMVELHKNDYKLTQSSHFVYTEIGFEE